MHRSGFDLTTRHIDPAAVRALAFANIAGGVVGWAVLAVAWQWLAPEARWLLGMASDAVIAEVLTDPAASAWLKSALRDALRRDPVDALNDALLLAALLDAHLREVLDLER